MGKTSCDDEDSGDGPSFFRIGMSCTRKNSCSSHGKLRRLGRSKAWAGAPLDHQSNENLAPVPISDFAHARRRQMWNGAFSSCWPILKGLHFV